MKYKLMKTHEYVMTRHIELKSEVTGKIEYCFDDSDLTNSKDFGFMDIGNSYECKLLLFGNLVDESNSEVIKCTIIGEATIGKEEVIELNSDENIYYILKNELKEKKVGDIIYYDFSRIDLVQVNEVIHGRFL